MTKQEIENHPAWKYISGLSNAGRYEALSGKNRSLAEECFNVSVEEWPFTMLSKIPDNCAYISATDSFRNIAMIMVLKPL